MILSSNELDVLIMQHGKDGTPSDSRYIWVKYAQDENGKGLTDDPTGAIYIGIAYNKSEATESENPKDYTWAKIRGENGKDAVQTYTWVKYADSPTSGMSDDPDGKTYIGLAYNKTEKKESTNYSDYSWSLIKGEKGTPGQNGKDAVQTYTWIMYADDINGKNMSDDPKGKEYIGFVYNQIASTPSTDPSVYKWSLFKGSDGVNGKDAYTISLQNDNISFSVSGENNIIDKQQSFNCTVSVLKGKEAFPFTINTISNTSPISISVKSPTITLTAASGTKFSTTSGAIKVPISVDGLLFYKDITWSLSKIGKDGADAVQTYTWIKYADSPTSGMSDLPEDKTYMGIAYNKTEKIESTNYSDYSWSLIKGADGIKGKDGETTYTWIKYADDIKGTNMSDDPTNKWYIGIAYNKGTIKKSDNPSDYAWSLYRGADGVDGKNGKDATERYTWIKYADSPTSGMSDQPEGKKYVGIAYNKTTSTESTNYKDYNWSLIKGADGQTTYTWIKYADDANGTNMSDDPTNKKYIGIAYNKTTSIKGTNAADYTWSLFRGKDGVDGQPGTTTYTWIKFANTPTSGMSDNPDGKSYIGLAYNKTTATESTNYSDYVWALIKGKDGQTTYTWVKYADDINGTNMSDDPTNKQYMGIAANKTTPTKSTNPKDYTWSLFRGSDGKSGTDAYTIILDNENVSFSVSHLNNIALTDQSFSCTVSVAKGTNLISDFTIGSITGGSGINASKSTNKIIVSVSAGDKITADYGSIKIPVSIGNLTVSKYLTWSVVKAGADAVQTYTWIKYADSPTSGMSDSPNGKKYIGLAFNKTSSTKSTNYSDYSWSLIKGADGKTPVKGVDYFDGTSSYLWFRYAIDSNGSGMTDVPSESTKYMGVASTTTATAPTSASAYKWSKYVGTNGAPGANGYIHVAYANSADGKTDFSTTIGTGKKYMGQYTDHTEADSIDPTKYTWTLIKGVDGKTTYTWIKYADDAKGTNMSDDPTGKKYIGIAYNKTTSTKSTNAADYTWSLIKGENGKDGKNGKDAESPISVMLYNESQNIPCTNLGLVLDSLTIRIPFVAYKGLSRISCTAAVGTLPSGMTLGSVQNCTSSTDGLITLNVQKNATLDGASNLTGDVTITFTVDKTSISRRFTWTKTKDGGLSLIYSIEASTFALNKSYDGKTLSPSSVTFSSYYQKDNMSRTAYNGMFTIEESTNRSTYTSKYVSEKNEQTITYTPSSVNIKSIRCTLSQANQISTVLDRQTVIVLSDEALANDYVETRSTMSGISEKVDADHASITKKIWQDDIKTSINTYDGTTIKELTTRVATTEEDVEHAKREYQTLETVIGSDDTQGIRKKIATLESDSSTITQRIESTEQTLNGTKDNPNSGLVHQINEITSTANATKRKLETEYTNTSGMNEKISTEIEESAGKIKITLEDGKTQSNLIAAVDEMRTSISNNKGDISTLKQDAKKIEATVKDYSDNSANFKMTVQGFDTLVENTSGSSSAVQKATEFRKTVTDAAGNANTALSTANRNFYLISNMKIGATNRIRHSNDLIFDLYRMVAFLTDESGNPISSEDKMIEVYY